MAFIFRGHDDHLVLWIFLLLEAPENFQRAIPRVALRRRNVARARRGAFSHDNLVGVGIEAAQVIAQEGLAVQNDHAEGDSRPLRHLRRSEEHTSELQSLMSISYAVFCLKKNKNKKTKNKLQ